MTTISADKIGHPNRDLLLSLMRGGSTMKAKEYDILRRAVEEGVLMGVNRAHKHTDKPTRDHLIDNVETEVINAICEVFDFDDGVKEEKNDV